MIKADDGAIRVFVVDDHSIFVAGLRLLLEAESDLVMIGEASRGADALEAVRRQRPDVILLDLDLGTESGLDILPGLMDAGAGAHVLILTGLSDPQLQLRAVHLGATGVVHKVEASDLLLKAIRRVNAGEVWLNRSLTATALTQLQAHKQGKVDPETAKIATLTVREREVIAAIGQGLRNKEIGERLFISEKTVRHYLTSVFGKLEVTDRLGLMIYAYQHGLAKLPTLAASAEPFRTTPPAADALALTHVRSR
jgi:DNA-binding NarL/FixJ family response regulator